MTTTALAMLLMIWSNGASDACAVTRAVDGDTFAMSCGGAPARAFRLFGVDTPERGEPGFREAQTALDGLLRTEWLRGRQVSRDAYGRDVVVLETPEGDLGCALIAGGWAVELVEFSRGAYAACDDALRPRARSEGE